MCLLAKMRRRDLVRLENRELPGGSTATSEVDLWSGTARARTGARPVLLCDRFVSDAMEKTRGMKKQI